MHPPPRHHLPGHYRHRVWAVNGLTVTALGLIPLSAMAVAGQRAADAITPHVQAVPPPPTVGSQPTGVLDLITAPSTTATTAPVATDGGKAPGDTETPTPTRACRCAPRQAPQTAQPSQTTAPTSTSAPATTTRATTTRPTQTTTAPASTPSSSSPSTTPSTTAPPVTSSTVPITSTEAVPTTTEPSAE